MEFDWDEFFQFSTICMSENCTIVGQHKEALQRTIISRVYYAAYHKLRIASGYTGSLGRASHEGLIEYALDHHLEKISEAGKILGRLKDYRVIADYYSKVKIKNGQMRTPSNISNLYSLSQYAMEEFQKLNI